MVERLRTRPNGKIDKRQYNGGHLCPKPNMGKGAPVGVEHRKKLKLAREYAAKQHIEAGGMMPLDFLFAVMRDQKMYFGYGGRRNRIDITWEDRKWAAALLLPCFTPKLTSTHISGQVKVYALPPEALEKCTDEELAVLQKALAKLNGMDRKDTIQGSKLIEGKVVNEVIDLAAQYAKEVVEEE